MVYGANPLKVSGTVQRRSVCFEGKTFPHMMAFNVQVISAFRAEFGNGLQIYNLISVRFILSKKIKCWVLGWNGILPTPEYSALL